MGQTNYLDWRSQGTSSYVVTLDDCLTAFSTRAIPQCECAAPYPFQIVGNVLVKKIMALESIYPCFCSLVQGSAFISYFMLLFQFLISSHKIHSCSACIFRHCPLHKAEISCMLCKRCKCLQQNSTVS